MTSDTPSQRASRLAIEAVERDLARMQERPALTVRRVRRVTGPSIVYSVRLDPREVELLEEQAAVSGLKPTMLARNLIRSGLASRHAPALADAVDRLEQAVAEVRALVH